jgi:protein-S-isoprenylcysteine O-methyltransferase Ste14
MYCIVFAALGFFILFFFEKVSLKNVRFLKQAIFVVGNALICLSLFMSCFRSEYFKVPFFAHIAGWILAPVFFVLLMYSLFFEIPFRKTYMEAGTGDVLVTTGTYALVRHPGVLWLFLFLVGVLLITGSRMLFYTIPVLVTMDIVYVVIQEKYYFIKIFGEDYKAYQKNVPMLFPSVHSMKRCVSTFFGGKRPISSATIDS